MHAGSFFALIWFALIVIGVVSSIRKSIRQAQDPVEVQRRAAAFAQRAQAARQLQAALQQQREQPAQRRVTQPVARRSPPSASAAAQSAAAQVTAASPAFAIPGTEAGHASAERPLGKRLFATRGRILGALAASEILAPPLALRDPTSTRR